MAHQHQSGAARPSRSDSTTAGGLLKPSAFLYVFSSRIQNLFLYDILVNYHAITRLIPRTEVPVHNLGRTQFR
jgi:hypothetical protein